MGLLPSEGKAGKESTSRQWPWHLLYWGLDAASAPHGEKGEGMTVLHCPLAQLRGIQKKSLMESKETYFFFRSWEQRGQNHFPRGLVVSPTQAKWNHSMEQSGLSQPIISP